MSWQIAGWVVVGVLIPFSVLWGGVRWAIFQMTRTYEAIEQGVRLAAVNPDVFSQRSANPLVAGIQADVTSGGDNKWLKH